LFSVTIMPNGATIPVYVIVQAVVVAAVVVGSVLFLLRRSGLPASNPPHSPPDGPLGGVQGTDTADGAADSDRRAAPEAADRVRAADGAAYPRRS
jgi:hypothetical protein